MHMDIFVCEEVSLEWSQHGISCRLKNEKHLTPMIHLAGKMLNMTGHEYDQIKWYNSVRVLL